MKKLIVTAVIAACLALCAAVWPQTEAVEKTPVPTTVPAVSAQKATVAEKKNQMLQARSTNKVRRHGPHPILIPV
ncbi:MAG: hypothetical protein ACOYKJ_08025 [Candidatus Howiella sp.]